MRITPVLLLYLAQWAPSAARRGGGAAADDAPARRPRLRAGRIARVGDGGHASSNRTTQIIVEFANEEGRDYAALLSSTVYEYVSTDTYLVAEIRTDLLPVLESSGDIISVERDHVFEQQGYLERIVDPLEDPDARMLFQTTPYGISMVQADQVDVGRSPVRVCIADTGALAAHPDLPRNIMRGADRLSSINGTQLRWRRDKKGHGTHVAGTISASDNGYGVRGVGNIPLFITRALDDSGLAREADILQAIQQCRDSGSKVISLSLGGGGMSSTLDSLLTQLYQQEGFLIFAASGNAGNNVKMYPAAHPLVVAVGASSQDGTIWANSTYGNWLEVSAPGRMIYSTAVDSKGNSVYAYYSGTSMATPHAAGVAALVWSHFPECTNTQIRYALAKSAKDYGTVGCDDYFGYGVVQAKDAIDWLTRNPCTGATYGQGTISGGCTMLQALSS